MCVCKYELMHIYIESMQIEWGHGCKALGGDHAFTKCAWVVTVLPACFSGALLYFQLAVWVDGDHACVPPGEAGMRPVLLAHYITGPVCSFSEGPVPSGDAYFKWASAAGGSHRSPSVRWYLLCAGACGLWQKEAPLVWGWQC